jgi:hypothetical protein
MKKESTVIEEVRERKQAGDCRQSALLQETDTFSSHLLFRDRQHSTLSLSFRRQTVLSTPSLLPETNSFCIYPLLVETDSISPHPLLAETDSTQHSLPPSRDRQYSALTPS